MATVLPNPLLTSHEARNAEFQAYAEVQIVSTFGQPQAEYAAIHKSCGLMDLPQRALIELTGKDRLTFLNSLLTNQTFDKQTKSPLAAGQSIYAFLLNEKSGRILFDVNVIELGEHTLLEIDARLTDSALALFERYRFAEKVQFISKVGALHEIVLHGPGAQQLLSQTIDGWLLPDEQTRCLSGRMIGQDVVCWRDDPCGVPGWHLIVPIEAAVAIWDHLLARFSGSEQLGKRPLRPVGWAAFNACRVEAGRALFGIDFDDSILPAETGQLLKRAVSFTKGCYPGQEIVARMHARQQVSKQLVGLRMTADALPIAGASIYDAAGNAVGGVTSSTIAPMLSGAAICLGLVKKPFYAIGTKLTLPAEGTMAEATVVETPFT